MVTKGHGLYLTTFILASQRLLDPLCQLADVSPRSGLRTAVERIGELMEEPEIAEADGARPHIAGGGGEVIFENVSFAYRPDDPILRNLSFRIAPGRACGACGLYAGRARAPSFVCCAVCMNSAGADSS